MAAPPPPPDWAQIASFYAGRPIQVAFPNIKPGANGYDWSNDIFGGNIHGGQVNMPPKLGKALANWRKDPLGTLALATLVHEAIHLRNTNPTNGFKDWGDESQAHALGSELIPDLLQRFFGIKIGSKLSRDFERKAKSLSNYQSAYVR